MRFRLSFKSVAILSPLVLSLLCFCPANAADDPLKAVYANLDHLKAYARGFALMQNGKPQEAEPLMREILDFKPENPAALQNYGFLLVRLGKFEDSIKIFKRALATDPTQVSAWGNLGSAYASLGQVDDAIVAYKKYIELSKNDPQIETFKSMVSILEDQAKRQKEHPNQSKDDYYQEVISCKGKMSWPLGANPIRVYIEPGDGKKDYKPVYFDLLKKAFSEWTSASKDRIKFDFQKDSPGAQIYCKWTDSTENLIARAEGGHAKVEYAGPVIGRCDITLLSVSPTPAMEMNEHFAYKIYLHEVGHSLGLLGHSPNGADILFCGVNLSILDGKLSERDKNTLNMLYQNQYAPPVVESEDAIKRGKGFAELVSFAEKIKARGELETADKLYSRAASVVLPFGFKDVRLAQVLKSSGQVVFQMKKMLEAEIVLRAALNLMDNNSNAASKDIADCCNNLGQVYLINKDKAEAKYYFNRSLELFKNLKLDEEVKSTKERLKECL